MDFKLEVVNPVDCPRWDKRVLATNDYSFFHSSHWAKVLSNSYHYSPAYFTLSDKDKLLAMMPFMEIRSFLTGSRGVSLAFSDYCEPIGKDQKFFNILLDHVIDYGRKSGWKQIELRGGEKFLPDAPASAKYLGHTLALSDNEQHLLSGFRSNTRWSIRKAIQEGVETHLDTTLQSVKEFYRLHCMTRKRHGLPPQPFQFFKNVHEYILARNLGFVALASYKNKNIAGAVCFHFGNKALYKFSASDFEYRQFCGSNLLLWEGIKWYARNGFTEFCFGRTDCDNDGLRKFKTGWSTTENNIYYYQYDIEEGRFVSGDSHNSAKYTKYLKNIPDPMLRVVGKMFYRHMG